MNVPSVEELSVSEEEIQKWVATARQGDEESYRRVMRHFAGRLQALLYRLLLDWEEARDVAQETFIQAWRALPRYRPEGKFQSWLFQIGARKALDLLRRRARSPLASDPGGALYEVSIGQHGAEDRGVARNEAISALEKAVGELPAKERAAFVLSEYEGCSHREIARIVGGSAKRVEMQVYRARQQLREKLRAFL